MENNELCFMRRKIKLELEMISREDDDDLQANANFC